MERLDAIDRTIFLFLNNLGTPQWDGFWLFMSDKWGAIPLYVLLLFLTYKKLGPKKTVFLLIFIALLITCTDQLSNFFKYGFQRPRPCHNQEVFRVMRLVKNSCGGKYGYFSAHAANAFGVAVFFASFFFRTYKWFAIFLLIWGIAVGYSRIYLGVHYPGDVLTGFMVGIVFGWVFYKLFKTILQKVGYDI
ncbi:phosphatase PAP2 family protein [Croceivirga sp. JEA036]|uniref:phosphatase PAP2 family protein n=1 Tax=Croceivirga sp. JEA036 TaxID=2721162 RepID=UPI001FD7CB85|nr:phosphatase PAP2 family protein [Croceivirga sp. JEA036]